MPPMLRATRRGLLAALVAATPAAFAQNPLNVICPVQAEWCNLAAVERWDREIGSIAK